MTMRTEDRTKNAELKPARIEFLVHRVIGRSIIRLPIPANVSCPVWISRKREVQARGHLVAQSPIRAVDIARPDGCPHALLAQKSRPREQEDSLLIRCCPPMFLDS